MAANGNNNEVVDGGKRKDPETQRDEKTGAIIAFQPPKKPRTEGEQSMVVAQKKSGELILSGVNRTSALMAPTMLLSGHADAIFTAKFNHDGSKLASGGKDQVVFIWDTYGECQNTMVLKGHTNAILELAWSRDSEQLYTASADKSAAAWDTETGERIKKFRGHDSYVNAVCPARRGDPLVVTGSDDSSVLLWDMRVRRPAAKLSGDYQVTCVALSDDSTEVFLGGIDNDIKCWDARKNRVNYVLKGHKNTVTGIKLSPDGTHLLSNSMDNTLRTWDVRPFVNGARAVDLFEGHQHDFQQNLLRCAWSGDGTRVTAGSADRFVYVWDVATKRILYKLSGHNGSVNEVDFHPKEPVILSASSDKKIFLGEIAP